MSERSDDFDSSEETPAPTRASRRSGRKEESLDDRRLSRLKASGGDSSPGDSSPSHSTSASGRGRRGSGATISRSNSPSSEHDAGPSDDTRSSRLRRRSGKTSGDVGDDSAPGSPFVDANVDMDFDPKTLRKHATYMLHNLQECRGFNAFNSSPNDAAYKSMIKKPIDFTIIRRQIENGTLRNMTELHRDVLLMSLNAAMFYNSKDEVSLVYGLNMVVYMDLSLQMFEKAIELAGDCNRLFDHFKHTQLLVKANQSQSPMPVVRSRKETRKDGGRKRQISEESSTAPSSKKRRK